MNNNKKKNLLVVVDMQNDFIYGPLGSELTQAVVKPVVERVKQAVKNNEQIVFTMDSHSQTNYLNTIEGKYLPIPHCLYGEEGRELISEIKEVIENYNNYKEITKETFGVMPSDLDVDKVFLDTANYNSIEFVGVDTDFCVISNAITFKSISQGKIRIIINEKCCAGSTKEYHDKAIDLMKHLQMEVI